MQVQQSYNSSTKIEFYLLMFPRFPSRKKIHKSYFGKNRTHDFRTSRRVYYLLDHSGDDDHHYRANARRSNGRTCSAQRRNSQAGTRTGNVFFYLVQLTTCRTDHARLENIHTVSYTWYNTDKEEATSTTRKQQTSAVSIRT